ncbi:hypothetical protein M406DRAFT_221735, partial [Cryphonectria parasitica EP155]
PGTPGNLAPFDWNDLEVRFDRALEGANEHEAELAADFEALMKYFNIWASAASAHDNQRAAKRLQTRSYFVKLKETDLDSKRQNYEQVADLSSFHETHFGDTALAAFARDFLTPRTTPHEVILGSDGDKYDQVDEEDDDDGLGYYPDGVKRTLTDEQIAIFRHSELQALQKAQEQEQGQAQRRRNSSSPIPMDLDVESAEDGELQEDECVQRVVPTKKKKKNKKKKRGSGNSNKKQWEPDPERRKRTWDVVETGLDALAYD